MLESHVLWLCHMHALCFFCGQRSWLLLFCTTSVFACWMLRRRTAFKGMSFFDIGDFCRLVLSCHHLDGWVMHVQVLASHILMTKSFMYMTGLSFDEVIR